MPGNALQGNWKVVVFVDDKASKQQEEALNVYTGKKTKNYKFNSPALGVTRDLSGHSSFQGAFIFDA